ncbi:E3 SUMO-protein ligase [Wickerhamomyces ciferrii]|uniref:E3 SUMO-protein ligase n=1 Tax=Wickerhamomyces ciferrii (strain ATCC 14091 / BCRC 22168 / CBS 111 / JCM 3599 / NBRC 0793 / NRRL Y-1031 F-60-10) TaxID=1206466 RepID=K0KGX1_WICCF|nr:E3 SUMO-protein ligase [Wickerhamomyces ciferrii]CCH41432.1 E3 SUMO-protein ligase [Wickerhamomyces ciferrii]
MPPKSNGVKTEPKKAHQDDDIQVVNTVISCLDIISRQRINKGVKSTRCTHISCFDLSSFCEINSIPPSYYEKDKVEFNERPTRYEAKKIVQEIKDDQTNSNSDALFQLKLNGKNVTLHARKLTGKRKDFGKELRCPICNVKFLQNELIADDFMITLLKNVPSDVESIEIDESMMVKLVKEKTPFESEKVVEVLDIESESESENLKKSRRTRRRRSGNNNDNNNDHEDEDEEDSDDEPISSQVRRSKRHKNVIKIVEMNDDEDEDDKDGLAYDSLDELFNDKINGTSSHKGTQDDPLVID